MTAIKTAKQLVRSVHNAHRANHKASYSWAVYSLAKTQKQANPATKHK